MKIAVACDGLNVAQFFSQTTSYMCYDVVKGIIVDCKNMMAFDQPLDKLVELLQSLEIDTLIVGRIEYDIASSFCRSGIEIVAGAEGESLEVAKSYLSKTLSGIIEPCSIEEEIESIL